MPDHEIELGFYNFAKAALDLLRQAAQRDGIPLLAEPVVDFSTPGHLSAGWVNRPALHMFVSQHRSSIEALPATARLVDLLAAEGTIYTPPMVDDRMTPITPTAEQRASSIFERLPYFLQSYLERSGTVDLLHEHFASTYADFRYTWHRPTVERTVLVPLLHFSSLVDELEFTPQFALVPLTPADKQAIWNPDLFGSGDVSATQLDSCKYALRATYQSAVTHSDTSHSIPHIERALLSFRLIKPGDVFPARAYEFVSTRFPGTNSGSSLLSKWRPLPQSPEPYTLERADVPRLLHVFAKLQSLQDVGAYGQLSIAVTRFEQAYARQSPEDEIIDLTIGLESTLLYGLRDELKYRLALRGACLTGRKIPAADSVALLRKLYDVRSAIVHEGKTIASQAKDGLIGGVPVAAYPAAVADWYRSALLVLVERLGAGDSLHQLVAALESEIVGKLATPAATPHGS